MIIAVTAFTCVVVHGQNQPRPMWNFLMEFLTFRW